VLHKWNFFSKILQNRTCSKYPFHTGNWFQNKFHNCEIYFEISFQCERGLTEAQRRRTSKSKKCSTCNAKAHLQIIRACHVLTRDKHLPTCSMSHNYLPLLPSCRASLHCGPGPVCYTDPPRGFRPPWLQITPPHLTPIQTPLARYIIPPTVCLFNFTACVSNKIQTDDAQKPVL